MCKVRLQISEKYDRVFLRVLLTYRNLPKLRSYNPHTCLNGPWIIRGSKHYSQTVWRDQDNPNITKRLDVEFMLELPEENMHTLYQEWTLQLTMPSSSKRSRWKNEGDIFYKDQDSEVLAVFGLLMVLVCHGWDTLSVVIKSTEFNKLVVSHLGREDEGVKDLEKNFRQVVSLEVNNCSKKVDKKQIEKQMAKLQNRNRKSVFKIFLTLGIAHVCDKERICKKAYLANGFCTA